MSLINCCTDCLSEVCCCVCVTGASSTVEVFSFHTTCLALRSLFVAASRNHRHSSVICVRSNRRTPLTVGHDAGRDRLQMCQRRVHGRMAAKTLLHCYDVVFFRHPGVHYDVLLCKHRKSCVVQNWSGRCPKYRRTARPLCDGSQTRRGVRSSSLSRRSRFCGPPTKSTPAPL